MIKNGNIVAWVVILGISRLTAQPPGISWAKTFGGEGFDAAHFVKETSDGGYVIAGYTTSFGEGSYDIYLVKTDQNGDLEWTKTYGGKGSDVGYSVQETTDGGYIVAARTTSFGEGEGDIYLVKTDANGDVQWTKTYGGEDEEGVGLVYQTADGGFILTGYTYSYATGFVGDVYLVKTDSSGDTLWTKTYGGPIGEDWGVSVIQTPDGGYIIAGITWALGAGYWDVYLIKTDSAGDTLWTRTYGTEESEYALLGLPVSDGGYITAGWQENSYGGMQDAYIVKTDADGSLLWTKVYGTEANDYAHSICESAEGEYVAAGCTYSAAQGDLYLTKLDAGGGLMWTKTFGGPQEDWGVTICGSAEQGYVIAGGTTSFGAGEVDVWLVKTEPDTGVVIQEPPMPTPISIESYINRLGYDLPGESQLILYSADGSKVLTETIEGQGLWEAPNAIAEGVYFAQIKSGVNSIRNKLIVIR
ncbi:T9SS type A sorting domain-containing protein [candidate division WOR-3 bacterium]|nr:T9SS type A sorting domain-containing protein [candidate division WOR-3 bacterium]